MADRAGIRGSLEESIAVASAMLANEDLLAAVEKAARLVTTAAAEGHKIIFFGNGGSAADATHLAAEFVGRFRLDRPPLPALSLTDNGSSVSAIGNDYSYDETFVRQIRAFGAPGDVAIGLSTSGTSPNVVQALRAARQIGMSTVAFTGESGGACLAVADICVRAPSTVTARIQESYMTLCHGLCEVVEQAIFGEAAG